MVTWLQGSKSKYEPIIMQTKILAYLIVDNMLSGQISRTLLAVVFAVLVHGLIQEVRGYEHLRAFHTGKVYLLSLSVTG